MRTVKALYVRCLHDVSNVAMLQHGTTLAEAILSSTLVYPSSTLAFASAVLAAADEKEKHLAIMRLLMHLGGV